MSIIQMTAVAKLYSPPTLQYLATVTNTSQQSSTSFNNISTGTASSDRLIVAIVYGSAYLSDILITSVVVDSVTMNLHSVDKQPPGSTGNYPPTVGIASLLIPSGTTCNVVINFSGTTGRTGLALYSLKNYTSAIPKSVIKISSNNGLVSSGSISHPNYLRGTIIGGGTATYNSGNRPFTAISNNALIDDSTSISVTPSSTSGATGVTNMTKNFDAVIEVGSSGAQNSTIFMLGNWN